MKPENTIYGKTAIEAVRLLKTGVKDNASNAWGEAIKNYTESKESRKKSCPKQAFLGLYCNGKIKDLPLITDINCTNNLSNNNTKYVLKGLEIIKKIFDLENKGILDLWCEVFRELKLSVVIHNSQLNVLLALYNKNLLN